MNTEMQANPPAALHILTVLALKAMAIDLIPEIERVSQSESKQWQQ